MLHLLRGKLALVLFLLLLSLVLVACNGNTETPIQTTGSEESSSSEVTEETTGEEIQLSETFDIIKDGKAEFKLIRSELADNNAASVKATIEIQKAIKNATGVNISIGTDFVKRGESTDSKTLEILIGAMEYPEVQDQVTGMAYSEYVIRAVGNKIVILAFNDASYAKAGEVFCDMIEKAGKENALTLNRADLDICAEEESLAVLNNIPVYQGGKAPEIVDLADENLMLYIDNTNEEEYAAYKASLEKDGYTLYTSREAAGNLFATYTGNGMTINCSYVKYDGAVKVIAEPESPLPAKEATSFTKVCDPTFSMVGLEFYGKDEKGVYNQIGLFLIWRLSDGRFIVVDGGGYNDAMINKIYTTISDLAVDKDNITIAAWLFTHAHGDHTGGFIKFANSSYARKVKVENFIFNFTTNAVYDSIPDGADRGRADQCRTAVKKWPDANVIKAHTGQLFHFADATLEMIYTYDDALPGQLTYHNTTSLVFRVTIGETSIMAMGDAYTVTSGILVKMYGDYLKSNACTIAHHGYVGGTTAVYQKLDPDILFWAGGAHAYGSLSERTENAYVIRLAGKVYVAGQTLFTFTYPTLDVKK